LLAGDFNVFQSYSGVVIRRVLDYDEEWDEANKTIRKIHQETDDDEFDADFDHHTTAIHQYESQFRKGGEDKFGTTANHQASHLDSSIDEPISDSGYSEDLDNTFTPWGEREKVEIADLDTHGSYVVVAKGGRGGTGSMMFASRHGPLPSPEVIASYCTPQDGEATFLELELKLIADIGLIGFPNAGKSSLLAAMSRATPHIAPYPFTTLNPLVGYIEYTDGSRVCVADVPGLIQGASEGRGKGHDFLRHLERTKALIFVSFREKIAKLRTLVTS
jgi:GTPase involved in cell partitioning and DNA repair